MKQSTSEHFFIRFNRFNFYALYLKNYPMWQKYFKIDMELFLFSNQECGKNTFELGNFLKGYPRVDNSREKSFLVLWSV